MRCSRGGRVPTVRPGHVIAHSRLQGVVNLPCDGVFAVDVAADTSAATTGNTP